MLCNTRKRFLKVRQMLSIIYAAVADDIDREQTILECRHDLREHKCLVYHGAHGYRVVARNKGKVCEGCRTNESGCRGNVVVEGHVTLGLTSVRPLK